MQCDSHDREDTSEFAKELKLIVDRVFAMSLIHDCRAYLLVENDQGFVTFNSAEDRTWPPPDRALESLGRRLRRLDAPQLILERATEEERKELIQLLVYFIEAAESRNAHLRDWDRKTVSAHPRLNGEGSQEDNPGKG